MTIGRRRPGPAPAPLIALALLAGCSGPRAADRSTDLVALLPVAERRSDALDLGLLQADARLRHEGWVREGRPPVLWSRRERATLVLPFATAGAKAIRFKARCLPALGPHLPAVLALNGREIGAIDLVPGEREFALKLPPGLAAAGDNELAFDVPRLAKGARGKGPRRPRAFALLSLEVAPLEEPERRSAVPALRDGRLWLPPGSSFAPYLHGVAGAELEIETRAGGQASRLSVEIDEGGGPRPLAALSPGRSTQKHRLRIGAACAGFCRLQLVNQGTEAVWLDALRLRQAAVPAAPSRGLPNRPNIVLFVTDTLRADYLGAYGHPAPTSPRFDAFASGGVIFEEALAQSSWTRPAVASIFTGLGVDAHGVGAHDRSLVPELTTLAEALRAGGYRTAAFVANHVVSRRFGFDQGFEHWNPGREGELYGRPAAVVADAALRWARTAPEPFFLYVHTLDPHGPYTPEADHWAPFRPVGYAGVQDPVALAQRKLLAPDELRFLRSAYEGEIRQNDAAFGALLDGLDAAGRLASSLVAFTADHGEEFRDHGGGGHGHTLYQEVVRVPLAVRFPGGLRAGSREPAPVQQVDLLPTLLGLAGLAAPPGVEGRDLSARWLGAAGPEDAPLLFSHLVFGGTDKISVRRASTKLVVNRDRDDAGGGREELYDLRRDPAEHDNRAAAAPLAKGYLTAQVAALEDVERALARRHRAGQRLELTPEEQEQFKALGYLQ